MKKFFGIIGVLALFSFVTVLGDKDVNISLKGSPKSNVFVHNIAGELEFQGWDKNEIKITGTIEDDVKEIETSEDGNTTSIRVVLQKNKRNTRGAAYLKIYIPNGAALDANAVSADIHVSDLDASMLRVYSVSGELKVNGKYGEADVKTVSGDIILSLDCDDLDVQTVSGDVVGNKTMEVVSFNGQSVSGEFLLHLDNVDKISVNSTSGDIDLFVHHFNKGKIEGKTLSGEINIGFSEQIEAYFDLSTMSGSIRDRVFGNKPETKKYGPGENLNFSNGKGDNRVYLNTFSGDIKMELID